jgi:hypothetical protein
MLGRCLTFVRWWFGLTWIVAGVGGVIACPIMLVGGTAGGIYMLIGGMILFSCGWAPLPWDFQRKSRSRLTASQGDDVR